MDFAGAPNNSPTTDLQSVPVVFVVDDDISVRESLDLLFRSVGWQPQTFESAAAFLTRPALDVPSCLLLDVSLPDLGGLELQQRIADDKRSLPIVFITGHGDVPMTVRAMRAGAVDFLMKPFNETALLSATASAIERSRAALRRDAEVREMRHRYASLSVRERQVMTLVVAGLPNKRVASELRISEITVKAHRGRAMRKMRADSLADLVKMAAMLDQPALH